MRTKLFLTLTLLLMSGALLAQKNVNVDNLRFSYAERLMPRKAQDPMFFYYASKITMPGTVKNYVDEQSLYDNLRISGQRITDEPTDNDYIINVNLAPINITNSEVRERVEERKDKDGKVTDRYHYYWVEIVYNFSASATLTRGTAIVGKYVMFSPTSNLYFKSTEYNTRKGAADYWNNNKEMLREQFTRECSDNAMSSLSSSLSADFGFPIVKTSALIKTINEKKHPENDALRAKSDELKSKMEALDGTVGLTESDMADIMEYFKSIPVRYTDTKLKADVRLRYVAYYNLCRIYMYIDQPDKVKEWADLLLENGHDKKDAERLTKDAEKLKERLEKSFIKASQFETESYFQN